MVLLRAHAQFTKERQLDVCGLDDHGQGVLFVLEDIKRPPRLSQFLKDDLVVQWPEAKVERSSMAVAQCYGASAIQNKTTGCRPP